MPPSLRCRRRPAMCPRRRGQPEVNPSSQQRKWDRNKAIAGWRNDTGIHTGMRLTKPLGCFVIAIGLIINITPVPWITSSVIVRTQLGPASMISAVKVKPARKPRICPTRCGNDSSGTLHISLELPSFASRPRVQSNIRVDINFGVTEGYESSSSWSPSPLAAAAEEQREFQSICG